MHTVEKIKKNRLKQGISSKPGLSNGHINRSINKVKLYLIFWTFLIAVFASIIYMQNNKYTKLTFDIEMLNQQIAETTATQKSLQRRLDFNKSDKYIEKYAIDEFGLVHPNQVIIYNDNYKPVK